MPRRWSTISSRRSIGRRLGIRQKTDGFCFDFRWKPGPQALDRTADATPTQRHRSWNGAFCVLVDVFGGKGFASSPSHDDRLWFWSGGEDALKRNPVCCQRLCVNLKRHWRRPMARRLKLAGRTALIQRMNRDRGLLHPERIEATGRVCQECSLHSCRHLRSQ